MVVATDLEAEATLLANRRCLGHIVRLDELDGMPRRPAAAAVAHRHVAHHLNHRHLVDERLGFAQ